MTRGIIFLEVNFNNQKGELVMDKKTLIAIGLAVATGGLGVIAIMVHHTVRKMKIKRERKQLRKYVKKYLGGNDKALELVDGLSNFEIRILFKVIEKTTKKIGEIKLPASISKKFTQALEG